MGFPVRIDPAEQVLARQILAFAHETGERTVGDGQHPHLAGLGAILKLQLRARQLGVPLAQRGRAEALVDPRIPLVADAHPPQIEQPHHRRHRPVARKRPLGEVALDLRP